MTDQTKIAAVVEYAANKDSTDNLTRFRAEGKARELDLLDAHGNLRPEGVDALSTLKTVARAGGDLESAILLCAQALNQPRVKTSEELYLQIMGNKH